MGGRWGEGGGGRRHREGIANLNLVRELAAKVGLAGGGRGVSQRESKHGERGGVEEKNNKRRVLTEKSINSAQWENK